MAGLLYYDLGSIFLAPTVWLFVLALFCLNMFLSCGKTCGGAATLAFS